jgi:hypothetical protein
MARKRGRLRSLIGLATWALTAAALVQEVRKPAGSRTWHGQVAGFVPYDFRIPTPAKVRERLWNPNDERVVMPQVFGVGWTVNLGRVVKIVKDAS